MPKARVERTVSDNGTTRVVEIETATGGEAKGTGKTQYSLPSNAKVWQEMVLGLSDTPDGGAFERATFGDDFRLDSNGKWKDSGESPLALAFRLYCVAVDKQARAAMYESIASESTYITVSGERFNLMDLPVARLIKGVNGVRGQIDARMLTAEMLASKEPSPDGKAKILSEARDAAEKSVGYGPWRTAARKIVEAGKAREDEAAGTLVAV